MTTPTVFADGYFNSENAFLIAPSSEGDGPRGVYRTATVPAASPDGTIVGLIPFRKGASVVYDGAVGNDDLDTATNVVMTVGYVYDDDTTYTNDPDAFILSSSAPQTASLTKFTNRAGMSFVAEADGWIAATLSGGATTTEGTIDISATITYQL